MLVFYGKHTSDWMNRLNEEQLLKYLHPKIHAIQNCNNIRNLSSQCDYIIPLMENHMIELHNNHIDKSIMSNLKSIEIFKCKKTFNRYVIDNNLKTFNNYSAYESSELLKQFFKMKRNHKEVD